MALLTIKGMGQNNVKENKKKSKMKKKKTGKFCCTISYRACSKTLKSKSKCGECKTTCKHV